MFYGIKIKKKRNDDEKFKKNSREKKSVFRKNFCNCKHSFTSRFFFHMNNERLQLINYLPY